MGNYKSGRPRMCKAHLGQLLAFPTKQLKPYLGTMGVVQTFEWTNGNQIGVAFCEEKLITKFAVENGDPIMQEIRLTNTKCNYGNARTWLVCACGRRVGTLYMGTSLSFICRTCTGLAYSSQSLSASDRSILKLRRIKSKIDQKGTYQPQEIPHRRKWMHQATYLRIKSEIQEAFNEREAILEVKLARVLEQMRVRVNGKNHAA